MGVPIGSVLCNLDLSLLNIQCTSAVATNSLFTVNETFKGVLGSSPNVICQICNSPDHIAAFCSIRYQPCPTSTFPAMASLRLLSLVKHSSIQTLLRHPV